MFKSNYFKLFMKLNKVQYGKNLNLYGVPVIFKKSGSQLNIGENCTIKSSFLSEAHETQFIRKSLKFQAFIFYNNILKFLVKYASFIIKKML